MWLAPGLLTPQNWWRAWAFDPDVLASAVASAWLYGRGARALWRRAGRGHGLRVWQAACFYAGLLALLVAVVSPIDALSAVLLSGHMIQHLLLLVVAAPLLVLGRPLLALLWAVPLPSRRVLGAGWRRAGWARAAWAVLMLPPVAWALHTAALWGWHVPLFYQLALHNQTVHVLEHLSFLGSAGLLWWTIIYPHGGRQRYGVSLLATFLTALQGGILGALLMFSQTLWYPAYAPGVAAWGFTPLEDQQLAGLLMWIPTSIVYLGTMAALFVVWLRAIERAVQRREGSGQFAGARKGGVVL